MSSELRATTLTTSRQSHGVQASTRIEFSPRHVIVPITRRRIVMFRKSVALVLFAGLFIWGIASLTAASKGSEAAAISGVAKAADQRPLGDYLVRLRSLDTAHLVAITRTNAGGEYAFRAVTAGRYAVEVVDARDRIVGTAGPYVISATGGRSHVTSVALVGGAAAAGLAALPTNTSSSSSKGSSSKGSAADVAAAAASAGISGSKVTKRTLPSEPG